MIIRTIPATTGRRITAMAVAGLVSNLLAAMPAVAAPVTTVRCPAQNLQTAIDNATPGSTLMVTGTCTGNFTIDKNLTLIGLGATLDGNNSGSVVTIPSGVRVQLTTLTITHGFNPVGAGVDQGGGITSLGTLTLTNSRVVSNASNFGAGINNGGTVTLTASTVSGNTASRFGGGIYNSAGGTVTLAVSTVSGNAGTRGAGIYNSGGTVLLKGSQVRTNTAAGNGGGIDNAVGTTTLTSSTVNGNTAGGDGGGIRNENSGTTKLTLSQVRGNTAPGYGGGIGNSAGGAVSLTDSTVDHNEAGTDGGGIFNDVDASVALFRSLVFANTPNNCAPPGAVPGCTS